MLYCTNCQKETKNPKYCSRSCSATMSNRISPKRAAKPRQCSVCNLLFSPKKGEHRRTYCYECPSHKERLYELTLEDYQNKLSLRGKHKSWINAHVRLLNRSWNKDLIKSPCKNCHYSKHIELCHIKPITSFPKNAKIIEINSPNNIVPLCRNCHWELDNGYLDLQSLK